MASSKVWPASLADDGVVIIETPYLRDMVEQVEFDTIYHEHVFYYSLHSMQAILGTHGLRVAHVERIDIHGGSLRIFAGHEATPRELSESVVALEAEEEALGLASVAYYEAFSENVRQVGTSLRSTLDEFKSADARVAAYGAAAKGTVLLNTFEIGTETLDFVADRSPHKQGHYMPGVHVPIVSADELASRAPAACLLLAWNFAAEILEQQSAYRKAGGRFILPVPERR